MCGRCQASPAVSSGGPESRCVGGDAALDRPSQLDQRFLDEAEGRTVYLHAMHSVVDRSAYAIWTGDGVLWRSVSLSSEGCTSTTIQIRTKLVWRASSWAHAERPAARRRPVVYDRATSGHRSPTTSPATIGDVLIAVERVRHIWRYGMMIP
jgi:hypothetical protein